MATETPPHPEAALRAASDLSPQAGRGKLAVPATLLSARNPAKSSYVNFCNSELGDDLPLVDELAWGHLLERHLDCRTHGHLVGRGARGIGIEIDPRVRVQG